MQMWGIQRMAMKEGSWKPGVLLLCLMNGTAAAHWLPFYFGRSIVSTSRSVQINMRFHARRASKRRRHGKPRAGLSRTALERIGARALLPHGLCGVPGLWVVGCGHWAELRRLACAYTVWKPQNDHW
ncbi:hypothetical protein BT67DRAFT_22114 [Trichocladium antarcticum]|uniref:Uncharacterized protein n=1 Tax=Trichocladium antarcticum TaxID=1450529 RepID=A0AAN6ZIH1_9PEZI|nr:hypothetical protein BT67DRAFT_22114 [Trichocladium antarcticum]